jgi:hypothetical protein
MALAYASDDVTSVCHSVIEGVPMLIPWLEEMVTVPSLQAPSLEALLRESFSRSALRFTLSSLSGVVALCPYRVIGLAAYTRPYFGGRRPSCRLEGLC